MTTHHNQMRARVMRHAWGLHRTSLNDRHPRPFGHCLKAAWVREKYAAEFVQSLKAGGQLALSGSLIRSPIARTARSNLLDFQAAYTTARLGR